MKEIVVREELTLELGDADDILVCDEALGASLFNILHFLRLTHADLVLDYAGHVLDDRLVTGGELFTDIRLHKCRLVMGLLD